jgi:multisubunit Na+/H+ antiporter MnhB subunit
LKLPVHTEEVSIMDNFYRMLVPIALWLGLVVFVIALCMGLTHTPILGFSQGGFLRGAQTLLLVAVAAYCAHRTAQSS